MNSSFDYFFQNHIRFGRLPKLNKKLLLSLDVDFIRERGFTNFALKLRKMVRSD